MTNRTRSRLQGAMMGSAAALAILAAPAFAAAQDHVQPFNIPAEDGAAALNDFARQAGVQIVFPYDAVRGRTSPAVKGQFTRSQALATLAGALGLEVSSDANGTVTLRRPDGGRFQPDEPVNVSEVVVTGTYIPGARSASPVSIYTRDRIEQSGYTTTQQFMASIPQNWGGGVTELTQNGQVSQATRGVPSDAAANIHGLGPRATLTLLDGHRLASSGFGEYADLSAIPLSAIERMEVLTDGASALYGSDAVAGVVNLILRKHLAGFETVIDYGGVSDGGLRQMSLSQAAGVDWAGGGGMLSYDYTHSTGLSSADRAFSPPGAAGSDLVPESTHQSVFGTINQAVGARLTLYATGLFSHKASDTTDVLFGNTTSSANQYAAFGGARYELSPTWSMDLSGSVAGNKITTLTSGPFGISGHYTQETGDRSVNLLINGELFSLPGGPIKLAIGAEHRNQTFKYNSLLFPSSKDLDRNIDALFVEVNAPVFNEANVRPLLEELTFTAAGRLEHYSDFGNTQNPKFGVRWKPVHDLVIRATDGTSFNAPTLDTNNSISQGIPFPLADPSAPGGSTIALVLLGVRPDLRPETSRTKTIGADFQPSGIPGLRTSFTWFETRYSGRLQSPSSNFTGMLINPGIYGSLITRNPTSTQVNDAIAGLDQFFNPFGFPLAAITAIVDDRLQNIAIVDVRGEDFDIAYHRPLGRGDVAIELNGEHLDRFAQQLTPSDAPNDVVNTVYNPPAWKLRTDLSWHADGLTLSGAVNYVGGYTNNAVSPSQTVGSFTTADLRASYQFTQASQPFSGLSLSLGVLNVFDTQPPRIAGSVSGYDPTNANPLGRFVSLQVRKRW